MELNNAGRSDLANGIMKFGGYISVSNKLGVRLKSIAKAPKVENAWTQPTAQVEENANVMLSAQAKEDKMAADLQRLAMGGTASMASGSGLQADASSPRPVADRLSPLPLQQQDGTRASEAMRATPSLVRLDGLQRANALLFLGLFALGFGRTSSQVLDGQVVVAVQVAFSAMAVAHLAIACYGASEAARAPEGAVGPAPAWFIKLAISGVGGLTELRRSLEKTQ